MTETQTKRSNGATLQVHYNFNALRDHLQALSDWFVRLLGDDYAIPINKARQKKDKISFATRCIHYFHDEDDHFDSNPSAWVEVLLNEGKVVSGCSKCGRAQIVLHDGELQPAPSLRTLSHNDQRLIDTMLKLGCEEVKEVNGKRKTAVAFPVIYADGSEGKHYRIALEGKNKWLHMEGGSASEAVFGLYHEEIQKLIQAKRMVIVTESAFDDCVLFAAEYPATGVLGQGNAEALACDQHRETLLNLLGDDGVIFVWQETDAKDFAQRVANALQRPVKVISPPVPEEDPKALKDAYRLWLACGKDWVWFKAEIDRLLQNATEEVAPQPEPMIEPKIVKVRQRLEEVIWRPLGEITMPQNDRWQVEGLIKEGNLVILSARPKTAKSIVALNLAASVAMGKPFLDRSVTQGRALFVAYERFDLTLQRAQTMGLADCYDFMLWDKYAWGLPRIEALDFWLEFIERHGVRLFVVDTLAHFLRPELEKVRNAINAYDFVYKVMERLQMGASDTGCTIMLIHHDRKGETAETDEARVLGTTALTAAADAVFQLKSMSDGVICLKASGNAIEDTALHFKVGKDFWLELTDKPATTKEEKAARAIEDYLRQHGEATRKQLIGLALEIGLAENQTTASKLVDRVIDRLVTKIRKEYRGRELVLHWQGGRATSPASLLDGDPLGSPNQPEPDPLATAEVSGDQPDDENQTPPDPQDSPDRPTDPQGGLKTTTTDMEFVYGVYRQEATVDNVDIVDKVDNDRLVYGVYNSQPDQTDPLRRLTPKTNPISVSNVYNPDSPEGDPLAAQPETEGSPEGDLQGDPLNEEELWGWFTPERLKPSARAQTEGSPTRPDQSESDQRECPEPTDIPTEPERSEPDRQANPPAIPASEHEGSPTEPDRPATCLNIAEGGIEFIRINSISETSPSERVGSPQDKPSAQAQSEVSPPDLPASEPVIETPLLSPDLPTDEPEVSPPDEPVATLTERICPFCGEKLEPDQSGLATCAGCGRLFEVEIPPDSPDDDSDDGDDETPPESPDGDGSPPQAPNNGHDGSRQIGFTPPKDFAIPPAFQPKRIYSHKLNSPAILNRITVRQSDGSIKLVWQDKKKKTKPETVAPDDLNDWQPIEEIPAIDLPNIESVKIPPTVVLDIETTDKDPQQGRILAAGLALFVEGKEVETLIIDSDNGERNLLVEVFDYLHATCDRLGEFILTGYNLFDFDLTYLIERAAKRNVKRQCPFYYYTDRNGNVVRWKVATTEGTLKRDPLDYNAILVDRDLPIRIVDTQHLVCRWDYTAKQLIHYDLKSVAEHFTVNIPDRPVLSHKQIVHDYYHNRPRFNAYLLADLRETYALFAKLIPPYVGVAALTELPLEKVAVKSTAWVWQQILERYYNGSPQPDEKRDYEGGLVVSRKGLWSPCLKLDIASLYPTIMLAYRIHSRKDTDQIALRWLKTLTQQRLVLKAKAKAGDPNAQILQEAMKILLNSLYGFYGTGGYGFNDMTAAERVTEIGRKVLTCMIAAIEDLGGIIVEADTDGLIVCYRNADPQKILQAVNAAIPEVFKVETEWQEATVFVSDDKNYVVIDRNGKIETVKGSKWRGRDKPAYARKAIPTFLQKWVTQGKEAALNYAKQVLCEIRNGQGWHWVVQTHRVGEDDTNFIRAGFKVGERAIFAYKVKRKTQKDSEIAKSPDEGYDIQFYSDKFSDLIEEVIEVIDPAQIEAWREIVSQQARPLFFGAK